VGTHHLPLTSVRQYHYTRFVVYDLSCRRRTVLFGITIDLLPLGRRRRGAHLFSTATRQPREFTAEIPRAWHTLSLKTRAGHISTDTTAKLWSSHIMLLLHNRVEKRWFFRSGLSPFALSYHILLPAHVGNNYTYIYIR